MQAILTNSTFIFWGAITLICVVPPIAHFWWRVRVAELEASLKHAMLEQGMSADEIARVLQAAARPSRQASAYCRPRGRDFPQPVRH